MRCDLSLLLRLLLSAWLVAMVASDLRRQILPHWGTTWLLIAGAAGYLLAAGLTRSWTLLAVPLTFGAVLLSDSWLALAPAAAALALAWQDPAALTVVVVWLLALGLVKLSRGATGAGDAKLVMVQIALLPDVRLAWLLAGGLTLAAVVESWRRDGWLAPWNALCTAGRLLRGRLPATPAAGSPAYLPIAQYLALPGLIYVWLLWPGVGR